MDTCPECGKRHRKFPLLCSSSAESLRVYFAIAQPNSQGHLESEDEAKRMRDYCIRNFGKERYQQKRGG